MAEAFMEPSIFYRLFLSVVAGELQPIPATSALQLSPHCRATSTCDNSWSHQWTWREPTQTMHILHRRGPATLLLFCNSANHYHATLFMKFNKDFFSFWHWWCSSCSKDPSIPPAEGSASHTLLQILQVQFPPYIIRSTFSFSFCTYVQ